jgi:hypothetical protein
LKVFNYQKGAVRTNCVDCLDRTNVVQSIIARHHLLDILQLNGIIDKPNNIYLSSLPTLLETAFRETWFLNGNTMSMLYAGTPALKTDFTRFGKRTLKGMIDDGINSVTRYFINNFIDHETQNAYNFISGKISHSENPVYKPRKGEQVLRNLAMFSMLPIILLFGIVFCGNSVSLTFVLLMIVIYLGLIYSYVSGRLVVYFVNFKIRRTVC